MSCRSNQCIRASISRGVCFAASFGVMAITSSAYAVVAPLYQWGFDGGTGVPIVSSGGGTLTATTPATFTGTGVSGAAGDNAYSDLTNSGAGGAQTSSANVLSGLGTQSKFTVTMWVNSAVAFASQPQGAARLFMIGDASTYDEAGTSPVSANASHPGFSLALNTGTGLQIGVGSSITSVTANTFSSFAASKWVFVAVEYDGTANAYSGATPASPSLDTALGSGHGQNNLAVLTGTDTTASSFAYNQAITTDYNASPGSVAFSNTSYAFFGNRNANNRAFDGSIDDVRIYSGLLSSADVETVRASAIPEPAVLGMMGTAGLLTLGRRKRV